ncbi:50S ribosome-binding protein YggL [Curvibacter fontanus]
MTKKRSRRLRKKLRVGEFQELGFSWEAKFKSLLTPEQSEALIDSLLSEVIEPEGLGFGGWASGGFIVGFKRGSVSESQRETVLKWLRSRAEIDEVKASGLVDAWYGEDKGEELE